MPAVIGERSTTAGGQMTVVIPVPLVAPLGIPMDRAGVQEVWDAFVKPDQDAGKPQSIEMRLLMAILRAMYVGFAATPEGASGGG